MIAPMTLETILRRTILVGIFSIPFIPFIVAPSMFFPFITGKSFAFRIIAEIIFAAWIILMFLNASYRPRFSWIFVSMAAFLAVMTLADLLGVRPFKSFWSNFERMEGLVTLIHLAMYTLVAGTVLKTEKLWERLFQTSVGASVVISLFGLLQLAGVFTINQGGDRLDATFGNAIHFALYLLVHVFLVVFLFARTKSKALQYVYGAILLLEILILFFTGTRGTILGLIGGVTLAALIAFITSKKKAFRYAAIGTIVGIIAIIGGFIAIKDTSFVQDNYTLGRFADISLDAGAARFQVWNMAWQGFQERPLLGWGQENFNFVFNKYYQPEMFAQEPWFDRVHNIFLDWLIAGGILGLIAYLALPGSFLYYLWIRRSKTSSLSFSERGILTGLLGGYYISLLFAFDNVVTYSLFFSLLAFMYSMTQVKKHGGEEQKRTINITLVRVVVSVVVIVLISTLYVVNIRPIQTSQQLAFALSEDSFPTQSIEFLQDAHSRNTTGQQEVAEHFAFYALSLLERRDSSREVLGQAFTSSGKILQEEIDKSPQDARLQFIMSTLLQGFGYQEGALPYILNALVISEDRQIIRFALADYYINSNDLEEAIILLKDTLELTPEFERARVEYAAALVRVNMVDEAEELLIDWFGEDYFERQFKNEFSLLNAYVEIGRHDRAVQFWENRISKFPDDAQSRVSLAAHYVQVGKRDEAIEQLLEAVRIDPLYKAEADILIERIQSGESLF